MIRKCDRCGKEIEASKFSGMSNRGKNPAQVCRSCFSYWIIHYIIALNTMHLSPEEWSEKWSEMYAEFLSLKTAKEKVMFT